MRAARHPNFARRRRNGAGFTLIEVLATVLLMAIVLPTIMHGVTLATGVAAASNKRAQAAGLAESKLNEILSQWESGNAPSAGDFGTDFPGFRWQLTTQTWTYDTTNADLQELDLTVYWPWRNREESIQLSTLTYTRSEGQSQ